MRYFALFFFGLLYCLLQAAPVMASEVRFQRLFTQEQVNDRENLGVIAVVTEDQHGFIWLGGDRGLARYDGHNLLTYRHDPNNPNSLASSYIQDLVFDRDGVLWVATSRGLNRYIADLDHFETIPLNAPGDKVVLSHDVSSLAVDRENYLIVGTHIGLAVLDPTRQKLEKYRQQSDQANSLPNDFINTLFIDSRERLWMGTRGGIVRFDRQRREFYSYPHYPGNPNSLVGNDVYALEEDQRGGLWVGTYGGGASRLSPDGQSFTHYRHDPNDPRSIGAMAVRDILADSHGDIWLATDHGGLARYHPDTDDFSHYTHSDFDLKSLNSNHVRSLYEDSRGDLWVGTFPVGLNYFDRSTTVFQNYVRKPNDPNSLSDTAVLCFFLDSSGNFWVGTENGLNIFDKKNGSFQRIKHNPDDPNALRYGTVLSITEDYDGTLWMGTWSGGLHRYDPQTGKFTNYYPDANDPTSLSSQFVWRVFLDSQNQLWVGTEKGGLSRYNRETDDFTHYRPDADNPDALIYGYVWTIFEDSRNNLWVGTMGGLERFDRDTEVFHHYQPDSSNPTSIEGLRITSFLEDTEGRLWIGTQDRGINIYWPDQERFTHLGVYQGLPAGEVSSLLMDDMGYIWAGTTQGLTRIDPASLAVRVINKDHGLVGNNFNRSAAFKDDQGNLYFGGAEGFSIFHPSQLLMEEPLAPLLITSMSALGEDRQTGDSLFPQRQSLLGVEHVTLGHQESVFSFEFALLNYRASHANQYAYRLRGFDRDWHYSGGVNRALYTNMDPGFYQFEVRAANRDGQWTETPTVIGVTILPSPWKTWWAYTLYALLAGALLMFFWRTQLKRVELVKEKRLNAHLLKTDHIKNAILVNTSHEFRKPLNRIVGLAESIFEGAAGEITATAKNYLKVVIDSGRHLSNVVDDVLEYSAMASKELTLVPCSVDPHALVDSVFVILGAQARGKNLALLNQVPATAPIIKADEARLQQVLIHLVDNAISYTDEGQITVGCRVHKNRLEILVEDTGCGISKEKQARIFDPFNKTEEDYHDRLGGAGLGLAVTKHLVELHGGTISVDSQPGQGSCFTVTLPLDGRSQPVKREKPRLLSKDVVDESDESRGNEAELLNSQNLTSGVLPNPGDYTVLVVDDDGVSRMVLSALLNQAGYSVLEAESGAQALETLNNPHSVDLVLLDVIMPQMSGYEACRKIRQSYSLYELPVIMLTAKSKHRSALDGFSAGANECLNKPVSKYELLPRVANQLRLASIARHRQFVGR